MAANFLLASPAVLAPDVSSHKNHEMIHIIFSFCMIFIVALNGPYKIFF